MTHQTSCQCESWPELPFYTAAKRENPSDLAVYVKKYAVHIKVGFRFLGSDSVGKSVNPGSTTNWHQTYIESALELEIVK